MLLCYNYQNGIIDEEEDIIITIGPELFSIGIINLPKTIQSMKTSDVEITDTNVKTSISQQEFGVQSIEKKIDNNKYEPKVVLEDKVYLKMYYSHQLGNVTMNETLAKIKEHELEIVGWTFTKY
jgi:hypothetical protein